MLTMNDLMRFIHAYREANQGRLPPYIEVSRAESDQMLASIGAEGMAVRVNFVCGVPLRVVDENVEI